MKKIKMKEQATKNYLNRCRLTLMLHFFTWRLSWIVLNQIACLILIFALISGCGYSTKSLINRKINSIYIPVFDNITFRRGLEFELTKAVKDEIMSKTNLRIVQKDSADTILYGTIKSISENILTQDITDNIVESRLTIHVDIRLQDRRTGRVLINESDLKDSAEFVVKRGETIDSAAEEGLAELAKVIVYHLEDKW
ncbi:MAG: LptE family protein [Thermodesulfobacteriota bacterium]